MIKNLCKLSIDKLLKMWYNGKFGAQGSCARRQKVLAPAEKSKTAGAKRERKKKEITGACGETRTPDPKIKSFVLYHLSYTRECVGLCILRIHDIFSACVVWFTFVSRKQEHLAVEDFIVKVLSDSRGSCLYGFCLASLSVFLL